MNELEDGNDITDSEESEYSGLEAEESTSEEDHENSFLESDDKVQNVTESGEVSTFRLTKKFLKVSITIETRLNSVLLFCSIFFIQIVMSR